MTDRVGSFWISDYLREERPKLVADLLASMTILEESYDASLRKTFITAQSHDFWPIEEGDKTPKYLLVWLDVDGQEALRFERSKV